MDILLERSKLIESFPTEDRSEARQMCIDKYKDIHERYANSNDPGLDLISDMIDMYLYLVVEPPEEFLVKIKEFLLKGITFPKLDIYMHLPDKYAAVVKLLRPEYFYKLSKDSFTMFTISPTIYEIASEIYRIDDDYINASSIWYIHKLEDLGKEIKEEHICFYLEHDLWECAQYALQKVKNISDNIIKSSVRGGIKDSITFLISKNIPLEKLANVAVELGQLEILKFINARQIYIQPEALNTAIKNNYLDVSLFVLRNYSYDRRCTAYMSIKKKWLRGLRIILPMLIPDMTIEFAILDSRDDDLLTLLCNTIIDARESTTTILQYSLLRGYTEAFKRIYDMQPVPLDGDINILATKSADLVAFCISHGLTVTSDIICKAIKEKPLDMVKILLQSCNDLQPFYISEAVIANNMDIIQYLHQISCPWDETCTNTAKVYGRWYIYDWLVSQGCPYGELIQPTFSLAPRQA